MYFTSGSEVFPTRAISLVLALLSLIVVYHTTAVWQELHNPHVSKKLDTNSSEYAVRVHGYLNHVITTYGLTKEVNWTSWHIQPVQGSKERPGLTRIPVPFQHRSGFQQIDLRQATAEISNVDSMLRLPISSHLDLPQESDASQFLFAISSSYDRLMNNDMAIIRGWQRWMTKIKTTKTNGANLLILLDRATNEQVEELDDLIHQAGIEALIYTTDQRLSMATRYLALVEELRTFGGVLAATRQDKLWFSLLEDSMFIPSISYLTERLSQYDTSDDVYVGLPSDEQDWLQGQDGMTTTYGGGAVFLTRSALTRVLSAPCADLEVSTEPPFQAKKWDALLQQCMTEYADMEMHVLPALYMPDNSDVERIEAPPLVSRIDDKTSVVQSHLVTEACGERCFLQKFAFSDNWVLENGREISYYNQPIRVNKNDVAKPQTDHLASQIILDKGGLKRRNAQLDGKREVWKLMDALRDDDGSVWQAYVKRGPAAETNDGVNATSGDSVIVLTWEAARVDVEVEIKRR